MPGALDSGMAKRKARWRMDCPVSLLLGDLLTFPLLLFVAHVENEGFVRSGGL